MDPIVKKDLGPISPVPTGDPFLDVRLPVKPGVSPVNSSPVISIVTALVLAVGSTAKAQEGADESYKDAAFGQNTSLSLRRRTRFTFKNLFARASPVTWGLDSVCRWRGL
jgi:hypothetical protein